MPRKKSNKAGKKGSNKGSNKGSKQAKKVAKKEETKAEEKDEDVKMVDATKKDETKKEETDLEDKVDPKVAIRNDIKALALLVLQAVENKDLLLFTRVARRVSAVRKKQTLGILQWTVTKYYPEMQKYLDPYTKEIAAEQEEDKKLEAEIEAIALAKKKKEEAKEAAAKAAAADDPKSNDDKAKDIKAAKEKEEKNAKETEKKKQKVTEEAKKEQEATQLVEVHALVHLLVALMLVDKNAKEEAAQCVENLLAFIQPLNKRTLDALSAKVFYYYTLTQERLGNLAAIRNQLLQYHRTAALQHNEPGQAALVVCILRSFLHFKLYQQADKFRLNTTLPESRNNDQYARYLYYIGQINAVNLQYSDAYNHLTQAVRKAPQTGALGFRQTAHKLLVIVQLLMGDIPDRGIFITGDLVTSLRPYFKLTQAVRVGDLVAFEEVVTTNTTIWDRDGLTSLISRLRNNVIKTGLRKINLSYSRISMGDVRAKLNLDSTEDAEHIVSKCIHDGVLDAVIDHEKSYMFSKERVDKYATHGPQAAFHKRIMFCMEIHNEAVKALRFPQGIKSMAEPEPPLEDEDVELEADSMDDD